MTEADAEGETALREWATAQKVMSKTVDLLIKDGFNSMEAVALLERNDLLQSKIPRGQQKLLLKALQKGPFSPNTSAAHGNGSEEGPSGEGSGVRGVSSGGRDEESGGRGEGSGGRGDGTGERGETAARQHGRDEGTAGDDVYARVMTEHLRSLQADDAGRRSGAQTTTCQQRQGDMAASAAGGSSMPGPWQDPQIHLLSAATGHSMVLTFRVHYIRIKSLLFWDGTPFRDFLPPKYCSSGHGQWYI